MKNIFKSSILLLLTIFCFLRVNITAYADVPQINAEGCALIDATTGKVLWGKNEEKSFEPASTTKVMTAIIVLEHCSLNEEVTVKQNYLEVGGSGIGLLEGDVLSVNDLLLGLLMESGNDCANALAQHVSGSVEEFAKLMNKKAKELGATNTNFKNPSGLPDDEHITTPHDLALFLREAIKNEEFIKISTRLSYTAKPLNDNSREFVCNNKNHMINKNSMYYYQYAVCGKNGYTMKANHTYVACAEKNGHTLIASFLNAKDKPQNFKDMPTVFEYGFNNFSFINLYKQNDYIKDFKINDEASIPLNISEDVGYVVENGHENSLSPEIKIQEKDLSKASFDKGDKILKGDIYINGDFYKTVDLVSDISRKYLSPYQKFKKGIKENSFLTWSSLLGVAAIVFTSSSLFLRKYKKKSKHGKYKKKVRRH